MINKFVSNQSKKIKPSQILTGMSVIILKANGSKF